MRSRFTLSLTILLSVCVLAIPAASPAHAQASAVLKAQQAQAESQKQSVAKQGAANKLDALKAAGLNAPEVDDLISTLEDPTAREKLVSRLKALRAASADEKPATEKPVSRFGGRIVEALSGHIDRISGELVTGASLLLDAPRFVEWLKNQASIPENRELWFDVIWKILAVLLAGLIVDRIVRRLLARTRASIEGKERDSVWLRLPFLIARTVIDIVPIAAFAAAAYVLLPLLEPTELTRLVAISLINASVVARAIMAAARMFFVPRVTNLRVVSIGDESANYIVLWIRRFTSLGVYGYFLAEAALLLGLPLGGYLALTKIIGLLLALLAMILILQNRPVIAALIHGPEGAGLTALRRRVGDIWHVLAILYVAAVYFVWALDVAGGFEFVFRATALSIIIVFAAKLLIIGSRRAVDRGFGVRPETIEKFPGLAARANRYFAILHLVITVAITAVAVFAVLEAWGVDSFAWIGGDVGKRLIGSVVSSTFVIIVAVFFWEMVSSAIERYLARGADGEIELSARAKTLLPLLRKALLIVVMTIVSLIVLSEIGVNIGPLLAGAGVFGLAIGFGSQTLVKDVITGVFILAEDQFAVGDVIRVNDQTGLVEEITIRIIRLRDVSGNVHMIPFSSVGMVENKTKDFSRYVFDVGIAYREDVDEVIDVLRDLGAELQEDDYYGPLINQPIEVLGLDKFADSAVIIRARLTTKPIKQWEVGREFNRRMKHKFDELGIEIPFPHQTVYFGEEKGGGAPPAYVETGRPQRRTGRRPAVDRPIRTDSSNVVSDDGE